MAKSHYGNSRRSEGLDGYDREKRNAVTGSRYGRSLKYSEEVADEIIYRMCEGQTITSILEDMEIGRRTIYDWIQEDYDGFAEKYRLATNLQLQFMSGEILDIADDGRNDWMDRQKANGEVERVVDREAVQRSDLRVKTRQWLLAKLLPRVYGDKLKVETEDVTPPQKFDPAALSPDDRAALRAVAARLAESAGRALPAPGPSRRGGVTLELRADDVAADGPS